MLVSRNPWLSIAVSLPSEVGYMAGSRVASAMDGSLQRPLSGARVTGM